MDGEALPNTRAPRRRASCTAAVPTPPAAPWTSTTSPAAGGAMTSSICQAVRKFTGNAAAAVVDSASGIGNTAPAGMQTASA